jgi:hypothetical protein
VKTLLFHKKLVSQSSESLKWTTLKPPLVEGSKRGTTEVRDAELNVNNGHTARSPDDRSMSSQFQS